MSCSQWEWAQALALKLCVGLRQTKAEGEIKEETAREKKMKNY